MKALVREVMSREEEYSRLSLRHKVKQPWKGDLPPLCVKEPRLLETQRMKEINTQHNTQDPTQTSQPKTISPSLLWPWNDHILLLLPHLHWEDKTHTELIVSPQTEDSHWFYLFFSQNRNALFNWQIRLPFHGGDTQKHSGWSAWSPTSCLSRNRKWHSRSTLLSAPRYSETGFSTETLPSPRGFDADLWQLLMGEYGVVASFISSQ